MSRVITNRVNPNNSSVRYGSSRNPVFPASFTFTGSCVPNQTQPIDFSWAQVSSPIWSMTTMMNVSNVRGTATQRSDNIVRVPLDPDLAGPFILESLGGVFLGGLEYRIRSVSPIGAVDFRAFRMQVRAFPELGDSSWDAGVNPDDISSGWPFRGVVSDTRFNTDIPPGIHISDGPQVTWIRPEMFGVSSRPFVDIRGEMLSGQLSGDNISVSTLTTGSVPLTVEVEVGVYRTPLINLAELF